MITGLSLLRLSRSVMLSAGPPIADADHLLAHVTFFGKLRLCGSGDRFQRLREPIVRLKQRR